MPQQDPRLLERVTFRSGKVGGNAPTLFGAPATICKTYQRSIKLHEPGVAVQATHIVVFWFADLAGLSMLPAFRIGCAAAKHSELRSTRTSRFTCRETRSQRPQSRPFQTRRIRSTPI